MAVVVYECDTCKREIHRQQNTLGIDVMGHCVITDGCRGRLNQQQIKPSHAVGHSTVPVLGLKDWSPRRILHTHKQEFPRRVWRITHNLGGIPIVNTFVYGQVETSKLFEITPEKVSYIDNNTVDVSFKTALAGKVQLLMRSSVSDQQISTLKPKVLEESFDADRFILSEAILLTNGAESFGELTIATRIQSSVHSGFDPFKEIIIQPYYLSPSTLEILPTTQPIVFKAVDNIPIDSTVSPWAGITKTVIRGSQYITRSANIHGTAGILSNLGILEGAPVYFNVIYEGTSRTLQPGELLGLLAVEPFLIVDKVLDKFVDLSVVSRASAPRQLVYSNLNWKINQSLLIKTFPNIITL